MMETRQEYDGLKVIFLTVAKNLHQCSGVLQVCKARSTPSRSQRVPTRAITVGSWASNCSVSVL